LFHAVFLIKDNTYGLKIPISNVFNNMYQTKLKIKKCEKTIKIPCKVLVVKGLGLKN